jgi:methylmalonyl-CoA mutase N-terminal domain/subunit
VIGAVLAGVQSFQVASFDEGLCLPTPEASRIALRTSQIVAYETDLGYTVDPFGGSYFIESLTTQMETEIMRYLDKISSEGGMINAFQKGWLEDQILKARVQKAKLIETGEKTVVGVNEFKINEEEDSPIALSIPKTEEWEKTRRQYLKEWRQNRNNVITTECLERVYNGMKSTSNMIPIISDALTAGATVGEIHRAMRDASL